MVRQKNGKKSKGNSEEIDPNKKVLSETANIQPNKQNDVAQLMTFFGIELDNAKDTSEEPEIEIIENVDTTLTENSSWFTSQTVDNGVVNSILATLNKLAATERYECIQLDSDDDDTENCSPPALAPSSSAPSEIINPEVVGSNESFFNSTINSMEASFCMMSGTPQEILLSFQFLLREIFLAFRRCTDSNYVIREKKMPELTWATEFLIRIRGNHFYTLTNLSCTLAGDMFDLTQVKEIMDNHRKICKTNFKNPKLNHKWSNVQKLAQFIPILLCTKCREHEIDDETIRALFEIFDSLPQGVCTNYSKYSSSNKALQKKLSEQSEKEGAEVDDIVKKTNRYRLILRYIFFDVPRSSDCNNVLNNTCSFFKNDNFRINFLKKLRKLHSCEAETMTIHLSDSTFFLGDVPELLASHDAECQGKIVFSPNFEELSILEKLVSIIPLLLCQDCNRSVLTEEQLNILDTACTNLKVSCSQKGVVLIAKAKDLKKRPSDTQNEAISQDSKKRSKKSLT